MDPTFWIHWGNEEDPAKEADEIIELGKPGEYNIVEVNERKFSRRRE